MLGHVKREGSVHDAAIPALEPSNRFLAIKILLLRLCPSLCLSLHPTITLKSYKKLCPVPRKCWRQQGQVGTTQGVFNLSWTCYRAAWNWKEFSSPDRRIFLESVHISAYTEVLQNRTSTWKDLKRFQQSRQVVFKINYVPAKTYSWCCYSCIPWDLLRKWSQWNQPVNQRASVLLW